MILEQFFSTFRDFIDAIPGVDTASSFKSLESYARMAKKQICDIVTSDIFNTIASGNNTVLKGELGIALGYLSLYKYSPFSAVNARNAGKDVYKYEYEAMRNEYIDGYYAAMDSLLELLFTGELKDEWLKTQQASRITTLAIKSCAELNTYYPIDNSYLFFFRTIPIQEEHLDDSFNSLFERIKDKQREDLTLKAKRALSQMIVATAIQRFDAMELPASIRTISSLSGDQKFLKHKVPDEYPMDKLAVDLIASATDMIRTIDSILENQDTAIDSFDIVNNPEDKIYLV